MGKEDRGQAVKVIYLLLYDLPPGHPYRVIFMRRDLDEVLASQSKMLQRRGEAGATVSPDELRDFYGTARKIDEWLATITTSTSWTSITAT